MAYTIFGGGPADITTNTSGAVVGGIQFDVWTRLTGGVRVTDLLSEHGEPLAGKVVSETTAGSDLGRIKFQAPDSHNVLYLDRGYGGRWQIIPQQLSETVSVATQKSVEALAQSTRAMVDAEAALTVSRAQVDVRQFGAVGGGNVDDTNAFIAALAELKSRGGGTLYVPPLVYRIAGHIPLVDNVSIEGWGATFLKHTGARSSYAYFSSQSLGARGYGSGCRNVRVAGIRFTGDFATDTTTCGFGLHHAQDVIIEQCIFDQVQGPGHCIDLAGCDRVTVRDCRFIGHLEAAAGSAYRRAEAIQIDISQIGAPSVVDQDGSYDGLFTRNVTVERCSFETLTLGLTEYPAPNPIGSHAMREGTVAENITLRDCTIARLTEDSTSAWRGGIHFTGVRGLTIERNTFTTAGDARVIALYSTNKGSPIAHDPNTPIPPAITIAPILVEDVRIVGNTFRIANTVITAPQESIWVEGVAAAYADIVVIEGNRFILTAQLGELIKGVCVASMRVAGNTGTGIHKAFVVDQGRNVSSVGNRWTGAARTPQSYTGQPMEHFKSVSTLTVDDDTISKPLDQGILVDDSSEDITITGVIVKNTTIPVTSRGHAISVASGKQFTITACKIAKDNASLTGAAINAYGASARGLITGNVITGYSSTVTTGGISTITATGNI